jgi:dihydroneopterin triphosphate diphosphatase
MNSEISRPKIPVSVLVVLHDGAGGVLLIERADRPGYWQSVTGSLDAPDEDLRQACVREVAEETGVIVAGPGVPQSALVDTGRTNLYEIFTQWRHRYAPGVTENREHVYELQIPPGTRPVLAPREHLQWRWLAWAEAAEACFSPSNAEAIRDLARARGWRP